MDEDEIAWGKNPGDQPQVESQRPGSFKLTRRDLLIGAASTLATSQVVAAESAHLDVYYGDAARRSLVIVWVDDQRLPGDPLHEWRLNASTFAEEKGPNSARFTLQRTSNGWRADLPGCSFPGGYKFGLRIDVLWDPENPKPSLIFAMAVGGQNIVLRQDDLVAFLQSARVKTQSDEIAGPVKKPQLEELAKRLFGSTFEVGQAKDVVLAFHHGGHWILRAGAKLKPEAVALAAEATNRFSALSGEGAKLPFREVAFSIFSDVSGGAGEALSVETDLKKEDVRALFSGDGAPLGPLDDVGVEATRVLYGLVQHSKPVPEAVVGDIWTGAIALGKAPAGETAVLELVDPAPLRSAYLAWRNVGDGNPVLALEISAALAIQRAGSTLRSEFSNTRARAWRLLNEKKVPKIVASLTPERAPMRVKTRWGEFTTAPLPSLAPRPGVKAHVATIQIGGVGAKEKRNLSHFAAPLALESAPINVGSERLARMLKETAKLDPHQTALKNASYLFSQLVFSEAECLFTIKGVPLRHAWRGDPPPATDPPQAEGIVHLGDIKDVPYPVRISLNRAALMVRRPADMLALSYRFQDLVLERSGAGWFVTPDRRLAAFVSSGHPTPPPSAPLICNDKPPEVDEPARYQERADPRPLLVVEFPPQHVAEQAFFRRLRPEPKLAVPPAGAEPTPEQAETLRAGSLDDRKSARAAIKAEQDKLAQPGTEEWERFVKLRAKMAGLTKSNIPEDQKTYIGPAFLDLETARYARNFQREIDADVPPPKTPEEKAEGRARLLRDAPEVELSPTVVRDLRVQYNIPDSVPEDYPAGASETGEIINWLNARNDIKRRRDFSYREFVEFYKLGAMERSKTPGLSKAEIDAINAYPTLPGPFYGRRTLIAQVGKLAETDADGALLSAKAIAATVTSFDLLTENQEPLQIPAEARASGGSRLVFRIPADDFEGGRPDNLNGAPAGAFPFTIEALTNWGAFDLAVVRRAEKVFEPLAGWESMDPAVAKDWPARPYGRLRPRWARQETRDEAAKLLHQGITRGDAWTVRHDEQRNLTGLSNCPVPLLREGSVTAAQRMSEVVAGVREPSLFETSIEIPFRLMLSPAQDANWRTPLELPPELKLLPPVRHIAPLWFAQLDETPGASSVRAVWSHDFRPEALLDPDVGGPPHGPWAPWALSRDVTSRLPYEAKEKVLGGDERPPERFRTGLDAADRHELVALTSLHGLPARGRRKEDGTLTDGSQIDPPPGFRLRHAQKEHLDLDGKDVADDHSAIYRPQALGISELTLTALGGSLDADTNFVPPASAKIAPTSLWTRNYDDTRPGKSLFDAFSVERWRQETRLSRDIRSEVVYKGFLFPLGHRCSLVKLTERRFVAAPTQDGSIGHPVAFLIQRMFLRIGTPLKTFPAIGQPNGGRSWPMERLEILTRVTPDILDPSDASPSTAKPKNEEASTGRIYLRTADGAALLPGLVFWPRVRPRKGGEIKFELQIDGRGARTRMPLVFVDNAAANDTGTMRALTEYYDGLLEGGTEPDVRRVLQLGSDKRRYAPETEPDGTSFETRSWVVKAEGREGKIPDVDKDRVFKFDNSNFDFGSLLQGVDQPPFYPVMARADVRIAQVDRLLGQLSNEIFASFDDEYRAFGFPKDDDLGKHGLDDNQARRAKTDVYLDFATPVMLDPRHNGERGGGPVRPDTRLVAMSRSRGPVGNNQIAAKALTVAAVPPHSTGLDNPDPSKFFGDATLLGIVDLKEALVFIGKGIASTPQFREVTQYTSALLAETKENAAETVAKVRDQLLVPLRSALLGLAREFHDQTVKDAPFDEAVALSRLARLYPDIASAYRELAKALDAAIELSATVKEVDALIEYFAAIYAAGRRFIAAIDRVANDPLAPVRLALRDAFNTTIGDLISNAEQQLNLTALDDIANKVTEIAANIRTELAKALISAPLRAWRHLVLSLPGAHALPMTLAGYAQFVEDKVDEVLADISGTALISALETGDLDALATWLETEFDKKFQAKIAAATGDEKKALLAADLAWKVGSNMPADVGKRVRGLLFDDLSRGSDLDVKVLAQIKTLLIAVTDLLDALVPAPSLGAVSGALKQIIDAVRAIVQPILDFGQVAAMQLCRDAVAPFVAIFNETLPAGVAFPQLEQIKSDVDGKLDLAIAEIAKLGLGYETLAQSVKADIDTRLGSLIETRNALQRGAAELVKLSANVCSASPARLQLDALSIVKRARAAFIAAVNQFQISVASTGGSDVGGKLANLMAELVNTASAGKVAREKLVTAVKEIVKAEAALCEVMRDATSLRGVTGGQKALFATRAALVTLKNTLPVGAPTARIDQLLAVIDGAAAAADNLRALIDKAHAELIAQSVATVVDLDEEKYLKSVRDLAKLTAETADKIVHELVEEIEQRLISKIAEFLLAGEPYLTAMLSMGFAKLAPVFDVLATVQTKLVQSRGTIWTTLGCSPDGAIMFADNEDPFGGDLSGITLRKVCDLLLVALPDTGSRRPGLSVPTDPPPDNDYLTAERNQLAALKTALDNGQFDQAILEQIPALFRDWSNGKSSVELLAKQLVAAATAVLSGDLKRIVDLEGVRRRIEEKLKELVPSRVALNYDMHCDLKDVGNFFQAGEGSQITLAARATYNLLEVNKPPQFSAACEVDAFAVNLFDVVTLEFDGASFVNDSAKGSDFNIAYRDFKLGPSAEFLKPLESLMNPGGSGPFVRPASGLPGIEVGYVLDLGIISIGAMAFINVSISASCVLPFDKRPAVFTASIGREERPVLLSCLPYVGGGFLTLYANAKEMIGFAASFEFGGGGAFAFGPLSGQGRISTGIYLRKLGKNVTIEGFFYVGGEARIACFAIAASLVVRVSHQTPGGTMHGSAVFTYSFSIGFAKLRYSVGVQRTLGKGFSGRAMIAAAVDVKAGAGSGVGVIIESDAYGLDEDWRTYHSYFSDLNGFPA
ncbi:hypothetical protein [Mesorhizobium sp.]|uniref:hypothetical protein n=1 Tax=Mesorhizobium sp. TaxID=1871066 RepID=UPI000FE49A1B|nr:hypothetical protein [Mesorhizobium sp.]RWP58625.1 MAG: hypothetical protein EOR08_26660 [Mesorhizobium sp.]